MKGCFSQSRRQEGGVNMECLPSNCILQLDYFQALYLQLQLVTSSLSSILPVVRSLLGHVSERLGEVLLAERQLSGGPDLGVLHKC